LYREALDDNSLPLLSVPAQNLLWSS